MPASRPFELGARLRERGEARLDRLLPLARRVRLAPSRRRRARMSAISVSGEQERQRGQRRAERLRERRSARRR